jgi:hypothetical protein
MDKDGKLNLLRLSSDGVSLMSSGAGRCALGRHLDLVPTPQIDPGTVERRRRAVPQRSKAWTNHPDDFDRDDNASTAA